MTLVATLTPSDTSLGAEASLDEGDLIERLREGDVAVMGELYDAHHAAVRAFARRLIGDVAAAEDLVHDVFCALPKALRGFRGDSSLRTFLMAVAVNHARHHVRGAVRRRAALERLGREPAASADSPEHDARRRELAELLTRALDALPIDQRVAFVLCEVEERTSREAALIAGVPEATIRTRLFHAKRKLRDALAMEAP
jgi:RNA polymerase sigma-70 factor (ECF subfamily)